MKITRTINGQEMEFELTSREIFQAAKEYETDCHMEDVDVWLEGNDMTVTADQRRDIFYHYEKNLSNSEDWSYCLNCAIEEVL